MTTPDEAAALLRVAEQQLDQWKAECRALEARLAAQQPVIAAAAALLARCDEIDRLAYGTVQFPSTTTGHILASIDTRTIRAALSGSVEADTPAEPGWEVHVAATGTPAGLRFTERGDAKAAADSLNAIVGRPWYDVSEAVEPASDDETAHGYVVARMTDATAYHGDRVLTLWSDDVHRTLTGASDRHVEDIDEPDDWEVYELRRVTIPLAGVDAPTEPADDTQETTP
ncbi:hypothetical protein ACFQ34_33485 [Pseudonocardia benzenivorans]|uniref:Uncharacterized protein n=2 Tax=Pseudonocardia benzenivorans TaxID=228005 RepID=A0ABW3VST7_9PSEU